MPFFRIANHHIHIIIREKERDSVGLLMNIFLNFWNAELYAIGLDLQHFHRCQNQSLKYDTIFETKLLLQPFQGIDKIT